MRVLILEPHARGHHASYLRWLVQATDRKRWSAVIATTESALAHPALTGLRSEFDHVEIHSIKDSDSLNESAWRSTQLIRREFAYWNSFKRTVNEVHSSTPIDLIILPYIDYCFYALAVLGTPFRGIPWCAISMRLTVMPMDPSADQPLPWKWRMAKRILRDPSLKALFVINPSVKDVPAAWCPRGLQSKLRYLPDPAESIATGSRAESRAKFGISDPTVAILVFGSIDERKGLDFLVGVLVAERGLESYTVILAGTQSPSAQNQMHTPLYERLRSQGRLIVADRFLNETEQGELFAAADVVWVGYRNHIYMSGVLVLAGKAGVPVVGTCDGEIGRLIRNHGLGVVARINRPSEVSVALHAMLDEESRKSMGRRARAVFAGHTAENFGTTVLSVIDTRPES